MYKNCYDDSLNSILSVLKCIKCGSHHNLIPYSINEVKDFVKIKRKLKSKISPTLFLPVCFRCADEFERWKRYKKNLKRTFLKYCIYFILFSISIQFLIDNFWVLLSADTSFSVLLFSNYLKEVSYVNQMEFKPDNIIRFTNYDKLYVKPDSSSNWFEFIDWIKDTLYDRIYLKECEDIHLIKVKSEDLVKCEYCGVKVSRNDVKCIKCGNLLPLN